MKWVHSWYFLTIELDANERRSWWFIDVKVNDWERIERTVSRMELKKQKRIPMHVFLYCCLRPKFFFQNCWIYPLSIHLAHADTRNQTSCSDNLAQVGDLVKSCGFCWDKPFKPVWTESETFRGYDFFERKLEVFPFTAWKVQNFTIITLF